MKEKNDVEVKTKVMNASRRHFCSNQAPSSATAATATADQEKKKKEIAQSGPMDHTYFLIVTIILSKQFISFTKSLKA